jgi:ribose transport system substrate-binding protein
LTPLGCSNSGSGGEKRIILLTNGNSPFWDAGRAGLEEAEKDLKLHDAGLRAVMDVNDGTPKGQLDKLQQYVSQSDIVAVGVSAIDANNAAIADQLRELQKKGVHVVTVDSDVDRDKMRDARFAYLGTDNLAGGKELGKCIKNLRQSGGAYVTFVGRTGAQNAIERVGGVKEGAGDKFKALDNMGDDNDRIKARENVRNAIRNHPDLNVVVGIWSYNAPAIVDVVKELDKRQALTVVAFDAEPIAVDQGVRLMKALVEKDEKTIQEMLPDKDKKPDGDIYDTGLKVVVPDEGSPLKAEMFDQKTQFLKLSEFRQWLTKYHLTGS